VERFVALDTSSEERSALLVFLSGYFGGCLGIALGRRGGGRLERGMLVRRESGRVRHKYQRKEFHIRIPKKKRKGYI